MKHYNTNFFSAVGINCYGHDSSISLITSEQALACSEERLCGDKRTGRFPSSALNWIISEEQWIQDSCELISYSYNPAVAIRNHDLPILPPMMFLPGIEMRHYLWQFPIDIHRNMNIKWPDVLSLRTRPTIYFVNHHLAHAYHTAWSSPFRESLIIIADHHGETECVSIFSHVDLQIEKLWSISYPNSIGGLYTFFADALGFNGGEREGKLMTIATFGDSGRYINELQNWFKWDFYKEKFFVNFEKIPIGRSIEEQKRAINFWKTMILQNQTFEELSNLAASVQSLTEIYLSSLLSFAGTLTQSSNLCLGGGVFLNCIANMKALNGRWDSVHIPNGCGDSGAAIGAAIAAMVDGGFSVKIPSRPISDFLGPIVETHTLENLAKQKGIQVEYCADVSEFAADLLISGKIIAVASGRCEFGPRALGNRSILCAPWVSEIRNKVNTLKGRPAYQPIAPVCFEKDFSRYFSCQYGWDRSYMNIGAKAKRDTQKELPAIVHTDGTSRVQVLNDNSNTLLASIMRKIEEKGLHPVVGNTSFNRKGKPIPANANGILDEFLGLEIDYLFSEGIILRKGLSLNG